MRLFYSNLIDLAGVLFTAGSYDVSFPPQNLANEHRSNPYRTGATAADEYVIIDLGASPGAVTACILLDHTLTAGDSNIKIQANATNSWGAPAVSEDLTWASGTISKTFSTQTYRYWRLIFTKSSSSEQRDIGRLFLGTYYTTTEGVTDAKYSHNDLSQHVTSEGGQDFTDAQDSFRVIPIKFGSISQTQKTALETFSETIKTHTAFFVQVDESDSNFNELIYAKLREMIEFQPAGWHSDGGHCWDADFELKEML